jgi:N-acetylmuramoyl-L-alanine amidase
MTAALIASILVAFPAENQRLPETDRAYVIGAADTNRKERLYLNGVEIDVYRTGAFLAMVKTKPGTNTLEFVQGGDSVTRNFVVAASQPKPSAEIQPSKPRNPYEDLGLPTNAVFAAKPPKGSRPSDVHVVVDAGHGGRDPGALSPRGFKEKDMNLNQAKSLADELQKAGFRVTMTRTDDSFPALYDRPRFAVRQKADLFISIHHNATGVGGNPREARHTVTYASNEAGMALAKAVQRQVGQVLAPVKDNGARLKSFAVCRNPAVPSCLVEVDFINLPEGEEACLDPQRRRRVSRAIVMGVLDWLAE